MRKVFFALVFLMLSISVAAKLKPGELPVKFPVVKTSAKSGDWVLCPPRLWLDQAAQKGLDQQTMIFYGATMDKPGPEESTIKTLMGESQVLPNSLIIPLRKGKKAKVGDIVLTWWQSGSGMMRAVVVKGGTPESPKVLYLDMDYTNPSGCAQKVDTLKPDTFHLLSAPMAPGTGVAVRDGARWRHGQVVRVEAGQVLVLGFAGRLTVAARKDCIGLPVNPVGLKPGMAVMARTAYGTMDAATVKKVDPAIGRVFVQFTSGSKQELAVALGDVVAKL